ncbi:unnamed protein product [Zymoseptoria tritici ST99CH_1A5]|uniref:Uncharacterized protein n=2 Tax=Zymoseptoria tritici TaxID=1047171 RepID=A0A2H1FLN5_ZYMTR|nr:unnamed protein product [Zymoseptoria tritici ST99CH_1E4]SMR44383.1 unnamed protein product [Zymoseptoria tritici ST99CH_3D1]SMY19537.1 unnamed protein product [Zymoseptoria tritici ST99CH_1A5]
MGKAGRAACILTPMLLTLASLICLLLVQLGGINKSNDTLNSMSFFTANLTNFTSTSISGDSTLALALQQVQDTGSVADIYQIHLWNYCTANSSADGDTDMDKCSKRKQNFVFDPVKVWGLEVANATKDSSGSASDNAIQAAIHNVADNINDYEEKILGKSGKEALHAYRTVAKWMFIAYQVAFWTTLATLVVGIFAVFSRIGSLCTWILALISTLFTFIAVLMSTILFSVLVPALNKVLDDYGIKLSLSTPQLTVVWLAVAFSLAGSLFWLFSICCCSGRSNPHHRSNKGGLWNAEPKGQGYGVADQQHHAAWAGERRSRGLQVEKTGGDYERVTSPYAGHGGEESVPLNDYAQPTSYSSGGLGGNRHYAQQVGSEPYRHA